LAWAKSAAARARPRWCRRAAVDVQHLCHLRSALALRDPHFQRLARLDLRHAEAAEHGGMQERIPRAVGQLDKAEALFRFEPFDDRLNRRSGGFFEARSTETGRLAKIARRLVKLLIVKGAPTPLTKITILFQDGFLSVATRLPS